MYQAVHCSFFAYPGLPLTIRKYVSASPDLCYTFPMTDGEIREEFHRKHIADRAFSAVRKEAGGEEALISAGVQNMVMATMAEVYLAGWKDAVAQMKSCDRAEAFCLYPIDRDRITKPLKEGEIDWEAIENAKDVGKLDISVLGLSKRVYFKLQERGIRTIAELMEKLEYGLKKVRGIGDAAYEEVVRQVRKAEIAF